MLDATGIYYTSNYLDEENPYFLANTRKQLVKAIGNLPLIVVSHKPVAKETFPGYAGEYQNIVVDLPREHLSIYKQIMIGCENAKTKYVFMLEDDVLYSESHFTSAEIENSFRSNGDVMLFDMNKVSLFTWTQPPMFSFRSKRRVVNQLIAPTKMLFEAMKERFERVDELLKIGWKKEKILHYFGDPSRYEVQLGVKVLPFFEFYSQMPSIVFTHPKAYGYEFNHGKRKRLGDLKIIELYQWGRAEDILKLHEQI